tara:strand:- start:115 stop:345 length:231 start_codon:yes stop_codon:yes gene_type:complete
MIKTIYQQLKPDLKSALQESARNYSSAKRLKYKLMSTALWHHLTIDEVSDIISYTGLYTYELKPYDIMYGDKFLTK